MAEVAGLYYELAGTPDGPPLLLSSGLGGSATYWHANVDALAATHRLILYDHRGTGRSSLALPDTVTVADFADDMLALIDGLGLPSASVMGHAAGAVAALALALRAPERVDRLVLVNGWAAPNPHFARCFEARLNLLRDSGVRAYIRAQPIFLFPAGWISENDAALTAAEAGLIAHFPAIATMEKRIAALRAFDLSMALDRIAAPTLVLSAADDMLVPAACSDRLVDGLPNAVGHRMIWGGHACNVTDPFNFNQAVGDFLGG